MQELGCNRKQTDRQGLGLVWVWFGFGLGLAILDLAILDSAILHAENQPFSGSGLKVSV